MPELMFMSESTFQISGEDLAKLEQGVRSIRETVTPEGEDARQFGSMIGLVEELCSRIRNESAQTAQELLDAASLPEAMKEAIEQLGIQSAGSDETNRLYTFKETDLMLLERAFPRLMSASALALNSASVQVLFEEIKEILSNVRWSYGPPTEVEHISIEGLDGED